MSLDCVDSLAHSQEEKKEMALISSTTTTLVLLTVSAAVFLLFPSAHYARSVGVRVGVESPVDMEDVGKSTIFVKNSQKLKLGSMRNHLDTILLPHDSHQDVAGGKKKPLVVFIHGLGGQVRGRIMKT